MRRALAVIAIAGAVAGGLALPGSASGQIMVQVPVPSAHVLPRTRAERSGYLETSTFADVNSFIDSLRLADLHYTMGLFGRSPEGRWIPYIIAPRPKVSSPAPARRRARPVVYVQAYIHAGEVEGKESLLALVRDLLA